MKCALAGASVWLAALCLAACADPEPGPVAKFWTAANYLDKNAADVDFGGWKPKELMTLEGAPLLFSGAPQVGGPGLTIFPGVSSGASAPFTILDLWADHPAPWVQPVWFISDGTAGTPDRRNVFPVSTNSTFYSPWWRNVVVRTTSPLTNELRTAREVLNVPATFTSEGVVLCPLVPERTTLADDGRGPLDPATEQRLELKAPRAGWVEGRDVFYLPFGQDHVVDDGHQTLIESKAYFFVQSSMGKPLPVAAVLPDDAPSWVVAPSRRGAPAGCRTLRA